MKGSIGGDEFVVVLDTDESRRAREIAERVVKTIGNQPFHPEGKTVRVTASVGVMTDIPGDATVIDILRMVDEALYHAKAEGRNRVVHHDPERATPFARRPLKPTSHREA
jgi:diguanylate cyclase (GGDEF)-like protein